MKGTRWKAVVAAFAMTIGLTGAVILPAASSSAGTWSGTGDNTVYYALNESSGSQIAADTQNDDTAYESGSTAGTAAGIPGACNYTHPYTSGASNCKRNANPASAYTRTAGTDFQQPSADTLNGSGITFNSDHASFDGYSRLMVPVTGEFEPAAWSSSTPLVWGYSIQLPSVTTSAEYECSDTGSFGAYVDGGTSCSDYTNGFRYTTHGTDSLANVMQVGLSSSSGAYGVVKSEITSTKTTGPVLTYGVPSCTTRAIVATGYTGAGSMVDKDQVINASTTSVDNGAWHTVECRATDTDIKVYVDGTLRGTKTYANSAGTTVHLVAPVFDTTTPDYMTMGGKRSANLVIDQHDTLHGNLKNVYYKSNNQPATADIGPIQQSGAGAHCIGNVSTCDLSPAGLTWSLQYDDNSDGESDAGERVSWHYAFENAGKGSFQESDATFTYTGTQSGTVWSCYSGSTKTHGYDQINCDSGYGSSNYYYLTQSDIDAGHIDGGNVHISVPEVGTSTPAYTADIDLDTPLAQNSSLGVSYSDTTTDVDSSGTVNLGDTVNGTYVVTNTGNVTMTSVSVVGDIAGNTPSCGSSTLAPAATTNCTFSHTINSTDVTNGQYVAGGGHAHGTNPPSEAGTEDSSAAGTHTTTIAGASSSMTISETRAVTDLNGSGGNADNGDKVVGSYTVTNTGTRTISGITVTDTKLSNVTCLATTLAGGANTTCTSAPYFVLPADTTAGSIGGTSSASGTDSIGGGVTSNTATPTSITVGASSLLVMTRTASVADTNADGVTGDAGDVISYSIGLTNNNTSNGLNNMQARSYYPAGAGSYTVVSGCPATLTKAGGSGPTGSCTETHTITSGDVTAGKVSVWSYIHGTWNTIGTLAASNGINIDTTTYASPTASLSLLKSTVVHDTNTDGVTGDAGDHISYSFLVTNTGALTVTGIGVTDTQSGSPSITCSPSTLTAGNNVTCTSADYVITSGDVTAGSVSGTATATGTSGGTVTSNGSYTSDTTHATPASNDKVLLIMLENTPTSQINGTNMPFLTALVNGTAYSGTTYPAAHLTNYKEITQDPVTSAAFTKSLPQYLSIAAGDNFRILDDGNPNKDAAHQITIAHFPTETTHTVFDEALHNSKTAKVYADDMATSAGAITTCKLTNGTSPNLYAVRHTMWPYFGDTASTDSTYHPRDNCNTYQVSQNVAGSTPLQSDNTAGTLPNVGFLAPNLQHDGHSPYTVTDADNYLASIVPTLVGGSDFTTGHLSIIITEDEGSSSDPVIPFVVLNKNATAGCNGGSTVYNHYGLNHWLSSVAGGSGINNGVGAADPRTSLGSSGSNCVPGL